MIPAAFTKLCKVPLELKLSLASGAKSEVSSSASAGEWPIFRVDDPAKTRYAKKRRAAYLLRRVQLQMPTKKELQESFDCIKAVLSNFELEPPAAAAKKHP